MVVNEGDVTPMGVVRCRFRIRPSVWYIVTDCTVCLFCYSATASALLPSEILHGGKRWGQGILFDRPHMRRIFFLWPQWEQRLHALGDEMPERRALKPRK
ncbi:hypothetical protein [Sulfobacillus sp. hq2]|uniref:hypothetical protein n=1 Tax=Sulfobacillus TaxID=28033 RepID=UPI000CD2E519|nr:hypothetical protein [Sulfobacillus sp. hq2]POB10174.1 hypothetical protein CO251_11420 [Sulfobacillus sp. hq2]